MEVKTTPVRARRVEDIDAPSLQREPGLFEYFTDDGIIPVGMFYSCPCGCGSIGYLRFRSAPPESPSWVWDGNYESPTLDPSVHHVGHWHGWLKDGVWTSC